MTAYQRIALIGFSGTGKSTIATLLAERLGWKAIDLDIELEREFGTSIPEVFARHGEAAFRAAERRQLERALQQPNAVIATGGGAPAEDSAWTPDLLGNPSTLTVALDARPEVILERLVAQQAAEGETAGRPMLAGDDPLSRISALKSKRQAVYDRASISLIADRQEADRLADEITSILRLGDDSSGEPTVRLDVPSGRSSIYIGPGEFERLPARIRAHYPKANRVWVVSDENVAGVYGQVLIKKLGATGIEACLVTVAPGEGSKSLSGAGQLYDKILGGGVERGDVVVALGGGVIGDLAGFVAATVLRGVGLVQVPTSLLAMVDSSVGGKTGINHPTGKNLIGAFYQPPVVSIDPALLRSLPPRELAQGWGEIVKHAVIQPSTPNGERADLLAFLQRNADHLRSLSEPAISYLIRRNVELKSSVVEADEREAGIRAYLNFGHTFGHAIEAAGYRHLHGEAVSIGMIGAAHLSVLHALADEDQVETLRSRLTAFGLPVRTSAEPDAILRLIGSDKKRAAGRQKWVLMRREGGVTLHDDVPGDRVAEALSTIVGTD